MIQDKTITFKIAQDKQAQDNTWQYKARQTIPYKTKQDTAISDNIRQDKTMR